MVVFWTAPQRSSRPTCSFSVISSWPLFLLEYSFMHCVFVARFPLLGQEARWFFWQKLFKPNKFYNLPVSEHHGKLKVENFLFCSVGCHFGEVRNEAKLQSCCKRKPASLRYACNRFYFSAEYCTITWLTGKYSTKIERLIPQHQSKYFFCKICTYYLVLCPAISQTHDSIVHCLNTKCTHCTLEAQHT